MANNGRYRTDPSDLLDRIVELERRLSRMERTNQASSAAINTDGMTVRGGFIDLRRALPRVTVHDTFGRVTANGWGQTDTGIVYDLTDGSASSFSTDRFNGIISVPAVNTLQRQVFHPQFLSNFDFRIDMFVNVNPTGGSIGGRFDFRWLDVNNRLQVALDIQTDLSITLTINQVAASVTTVLASTTAPGITLDSTIPLRVRVSLIGKFIKVKVWRTVDDEPAAWDVSTLITDAVTQTQVGSVGVGAILASTNSNTLPVVIKFANFFIETPHYVEPLEESPDFLSEGLITFGSRTAINNEEGMAIQVYRSNSVPGGYYYPAASEGGVGNISGNRAMFVGTVDGSAVDPDDAFPSFGFYDKSGDPVFADTWAARKGMSDPILPSPWWNANNFATSTSGTFASVANTEWYMYHPHLRIRVLVQNDASNASELRIGESGGNPSILVVSVSAGASAYIDCVVKRSSMVSGNSTNGNTAIVTLEHRRTSGAGTIRSMIASCVGLDLSFSQPY